MESLKLNNGSIELKIDLVDVVTPKSCSIIISELIKYIIYNKQQIPYPYERLKYYIMKRQETQRKLNVTTNLEGQGILKRDILAAEKHYKKVEEAFEILENTFKNIEVELTSSSADTVQEVAVLFGSSIMNPKDIYRIQVPLISVGHSENRHGVQKQKHVVFRHIIVSEQLQKSLDKQVGLTNMFVLLKLKNGSVTKSGWFFPKDNYKISPRISHICVSFDTNNINECSCLSSDIDLEFTPFTVCEDSASSSPSSSWHSTPNSESNTTDKSEIIDHVSLEVEEEIRQCCFASDFVVNSDNENWFQTKQSLKGFRDYKIDGKPVVNMWHRSQYFIRQ